MSTCAIQKLSPQQRSFYFNLGINWQVGKWTEVDVCEAPMYRMKEALLGNSNNKNEQGTELGDSKKPK